MAVAQQMHHHVRVRDIIVPIHQVTYITTPHTMKQNETKSH
jgi:hypothetical protein